ncbi:hypothetical protein EJB05_22696, partial [Eragrostis curvula]
MDNGRLPKTRTNMNVAITHQARMPIILFGRRRGRRLRGASGDFGNLENLPAQSSKMLIGLKADIGIKK